MQTELHRHLDVSLRIGTLLELAQKRGLEAQSTSLERFREKITLQSPLNNLAEVLDTFTLFQKVLDRPETLERVAFETVEDCHREGTGRVELRFSPSFITQYSNLDWEEMLAAISRGIQKARDTYPTIQSGLICIISREFGIEAAHKTVEFYLRHPQELIGLDLAGNETQFPCRLFEPVFKPAIQKGTPITIHAGEAAGPESIWEAIELLGARRIGHGVSAVADPHLMDYLQKNQICLEMCPTSNWLTRAVPSLEAHPLPRVLRAGIPVCINTDDPGVFAVTVPSEVHICQERMGLTSIEIQKTFEAATKASFL